MSRKSLWLWLLLLTSKRRFRAITNILIIILSSGVLYLLISIDHSARTLDYGVQVQELSRIQDSLNSLQMFVVMQKQALIDSQQTLDKLRKDESTLKPLIQTDRQTVEAVLRAYNHEQARNRWKEYGVGFGLGVLSSMLAGYLMAIGKRNRESAATKVQAASE